MVKVLDNKIAITGLIPTMLAGGLGSGCPLIGRAIQGGSRNFTHNQNVGAGIVGEIIRDMGNRKSNRQTLPENVIYKNGKYSPAPGYGWKNIFDPLEGVQPIEECLKLKDE